MTELIDFNFDISISRLLFLRFYPVHFFVTPQNLRFLCFLVLSQAQSFSAS